MSKKCPGCGKTVYFAERQVKDGVDWHGSCLIRHVQDQKKGAQASNPFQSYRGSPSPSAPRRENSRPSSLDVSSPIPAQPVQSPSPVLERSSSPPVSRVEPVSEPVSEPVYESSTPEAVTPPLRTQSPVLREPERKNSTGQLSKVEEFLLQQTSSSTAPASLAISVDAESLETKPEEEGGAGTGFCSNCGEPRGTDGAKFCSNCGEELF